MGGDGTDPEADGEASAPRLARVPALDGVRGAAVAAVLAFHDGRLQGGFLGVDLFFVLSGYLITSLLAVEWLESGTIRLRSFWARRARRLLPALLCLLALVGVAAHWEVRATSRGQLREAGLATLGQVANWHALWSADGYWDQALVPSWLEHTWSLSIEEQVYVLWPLLVLAVLGGTWARARRRGRAPSRQRTVRLLGAFALAGVALSAGSMILRSFGGTSVERLYLGTDTRVAAVLLGAVVACRQRAVTVGRRGSSQPPRWRAVAGWAGVAVLAVAWIRFDGTDALLYRGGLLACGVAGATVIASLTSPGTGLLDRVLAWSPLVGLGTVSYGLYLYHWPIYQYLYHGRFGLEGWALTAVRLVASLAAALVSYHLLEKPIRERRVRLPMPVAAPIGAAVTVIALLGGTTGAVDPDPESVPVAASTTPRAPRADDVGVLVVGDSVAQALAQGGWTPDPISPRLVVRNDGVLGCGLMEPAEAVEGLPVRDCAPAWPDLVERARPDVALVVFGAFVGIAPSRVDGEAVFPCSAAYDGYLRDRLEEAVTVLSAHGAHVLLVTSAYAPNPLFKGGDPERTDARQGCWNEVVRAVAADRPEADVIDLAAWVCPEPDACRTEVDGAELRPDGLHYRDDGARAVARWMTPQILAAADGREGG